MRTRLPLWPAGAPGALGHEEADRPHWTEYLPHASRRNGAAVLVLPGGSYFSHATDHEGAQIAAWLNERGYAAWVLEYRVGPRYHHPAPLQDAARALRTIRWRAAELDLDVARIGVWGFSAGGHLAATLSTLWDDGGPTSDDPVERHSSRPDFAVLCYPVITMRGEFAHAGSRLNLLGEAPGEALAEALSVETRVTGRTPPTFLFQTDADESVPAENAVSYYLALRRNGVPAELLIYEKGPHGVGLAPTDPVLSAWPAQLEAWLHLHAFDVKSPCTSGRRSPASPPDGHPWEQAQILREKAGQKPLLPGGEKVAEGRMRGGASQQQSCVAQPESVTASQPSPPAPLPITGEGSVGNAAF